MPGRLTAKRLVLVLGLMMLVTLPGCGGCSCRRTSQAKTPEELEKELAERQAKAQKPKPKPNLELGAFVSQPSVPVSPNSAAVGPTFFYKPGHWTTATLAAKANNFDIMGQWNVTVLDRQGQPARLPGTPFTVSGTRAVALPKGQPKELESIVFFPNTDAITRLSTEISALRGGRGIYERPYMLGRMPFYQHHLVVLARYPDLYTYLRSLDSVRKSTQFSSSNLLESEAFYRVELLEAGRRVALPAHSLYWTTIATILWDDADPNALSLEQQVALLDWLHWGGQLIVSGPGMLDSLRNSFLSDYLPAEATGTRPLTASDLDQINQTWTRPTGRVPGRRLAPLKSWTGVVLKKHPDARYVPHTGELLVERRVGRGRIVVSAFALNGRELTSWPGFDGFFNACLLGHPPRRFATHGDELQIEWVSGRGAPRPSVANTYDARLLSNLRYFSRDTGQKTALPPQESAIISIDEPDRLPSAATDVASWDDFNGVAHAARESLQNAARIEIPDRSFVVWVVCGYLVVLVPVNWLVFRVMRRVEWAWAAAPMIAVACTAVVIRLAQLDIGFARSMTEIGVVELQASYSRAHVTRYTALYTSLSTRYDLHFKDVGAQVLPFPAGDNPSETGLMIDQSPTTLVYRYANDMTLENLRVQSNSTQMVHSEQMADLGGALVFQPNRGGPPRLINRTRLTLGGAGVLRVTANGDKEAAWIGDIRPETAAVLRGPWRPVAARSSDQPWADQRNQVPLTAASSVSGRLNLHRLMALAEDIAPMQPGDVRLVGWLEAPVAGLEVAPAAPQSRTAAVVVAHLAYGQDPDPQPDVNTRPSLSSIDSPDN